MTPDDRAAALRDWARGLLATEAAVELIIRAVGGRLQDGPWVCQDDLGRVYVDPEVAAADSGGLSGGERRVLAIATSLLSDDHPVDLGDAITGLDPDALGHVLIALAHAGGGDEPNQLHPTPAPQGSSHPAHPRGAPTVVPVARAPSSAAAPDESGPASAPAADSTDGHGKGGDHVTD